VKCFPEATGRDIKGLSKLVAKFVSTKSCADLECFQALLNIPRHGYGKIIKPAQSKPV